MGDLGGGGAYVRKMWGTWGNRITKKIGSKMPKPIFNPFPVYASSMPCPTVASHNVHLMPQISRLITHV